MIKIYHVALREFASTVLTKGFLIGLFVPILLLVVAIPASALLMSQKPPAVKGTVAIIDATSGRLVEGELAVRLAPEAVAAHVTERARAAGEALGDAATRALGEDAGKQARGVLGMASERAAEDLPEISPEVLPAGVDVEAEKQKLLQGTNFDGSRLALVVVQPDSVRRAEGAAEFGTYQLFTKENLDARVQGIIEGLARDAILEVRFRENGEDPATIRALSSFRAPGAVTMTSAGEKTGGKLRQMLVPFASLMLLWISVFSGANFLLYGTIEEKSNRIMEVLLSAVSPMQLMAGKVLGQMSAALLILVVYSGLGIVSLIALARTDLISVTNLLFMGVFFFIAFFSIAAMMAAVGAAVNDIHEAQTLMTPIMLVVLSPMILMMPIIFNPNSALATAMSFLPPISPFVMMLRVASSDPPPMWQTLLSLVVGVIGAYAMLWACAKIFRVGVLMYGKPPNFKTLWQWIRMA